MWIWIFICLDATDSLRKYYEGKLSLLLHWRHLVCCFNFLLLLTTLKDLLSSRTCFKTAKNMKLNVFSGSMKLKMYVSFVKRPWNKKTQFSYIQGNLKQWWHILVSLCFYLDANFKRYFSYKNIVKIWDENVHSFTFLNIQEVSKE